MSGLAPGKTKSRSAAQAGIHSSGEQLCAKRPGSPGGQQVQGVSNVLLKHRKPGGCWAASTSTSPLEIRSHYLTLLSFQAKPKILCLVLVPTMKNNVLKLERVRRSDTKKGNFSIRGKAERI